MHRWRERSRKSKTNEENQKGRMQARPGERESEKQGKRERQRDTITGTQYTLACVMHISSQEAYLCVNGYTQKLTRRCA